VTVNFDVVAERISLHRYILVKICFVDV